MKLLDSRVKQNETGLSLIEVLVSIILLGIILISSFSLIVQSAKTTSSSDTIVDGTFYSQTEIEQLYTYAISHTKPNNLSTTPNLLSSLQYVYLGSSDDYTKFYYEKLVGSEKYNLTIIPFPDYDNLTRIILEVYDISDANKAVLSSKFETTLEWKR